MTQTRARSAQRTCAPDSASPHHPCGLLAGECHMAPLPLQGWSCSSSAALQGRVDLVQHAADRDNVVGGGVAGARLVRTQLVAQLAQRTRVMLQGLLCPARYAQRGRGCLDSSSRSEGRFGAGGEDRSPPRSGRTSVGPYGRQATPKSPAPAAPFGSQTQTQERRDGGLDGTGRAPPPCSGGKALPGALPTIAPIVR